MGRGPQQRGQPVTPPCHPIDPGWASINRGVLICDECCSVHRSLGRHISIVKHLRHSPWPATLLQVGADPMGTQGRGHTGTPNTHQTPPASHRWCTPWQAMGQTPSGSTHCWIRPRCRVGAGRQTPRTKCSKCPPWRGEGSLCWSGAPSSPPAIPTSPTKSEFIRAKYQMLAFVHKLPCRDDDGVTAKDLSKVGCGIGVHGTPTGGGDRPPLTHLSLPQQLHSSVRTGNLETCLRLLSLGAQANFFHPVSASVDHAGPWGQSRAWGGSQSPVPWAGCGAEPTRARRRRAPHHCTWLPRRARSCRQSCWWSTEPTLGHPM